MPTHERLLPSLQPLQPRPGAAAARPPTHVAIIMDGNGRWAQARGLRRLLGHKQGAEAVRRIVTAAREIGLRHLTLYAFSTENWNRPPEEVRGLMRLLGVFLRKERATLLENRVGLRVIGDRPRLPVSVRRLLEEVEAATQPGARMQLTLCLSYGGRDEIARAARRLAEAVQRGELAPEAIDEAALGRHLDTADTPDPELLIRTGGELRLSNFLLWQAAYAELYFTDVPWPDFGRPQLEEAIRWYRGRQRRFGRTEPATRSR